MNEAELLRAVDRLKNIMIAVATGGPRIGDVQAEFAELYDAVAEELRQRGVANSIPYRDLWEWYGRWSGGDMPSWQSRRTFVNNAFREVIQDIQTRRPRPQPEPKPDAPAAPLLNGEEVEWDVFVSHASDDKDDFVRPLAQQLTELGLRVWYDEATLRLGDSLMGAIDNGLARSRFGVVVISPHFLRKDWTRKELDGLAALEVNGRKVILPVLHNITINELREHSPILAGKISVPSSAGIENVANQIYQVIRPEGGPTPQVNSAKAALPATRNDLVMIGPDVIATGDIESIEPLQWRLHVRDFITGDLGRLIRFAESFGTSLPADRFVVLTSIGDGRVLSAAPAITRERDGLSLRLSVAARAQRTAAQELGSTWATSLAPNDMFAEGGGIARVSGASAFPQRLREVMSHLRGESPMHPHFGSRLQEYYWRHHDSPSLTDILEAEVIRLASISVSDAALRNTSTQLQCVERVWGLETVAAQPTDDRLLMRLDLDVKGLGRGTHDVSVLMPPPEKVREILTRRPPIGMSGRGPLRFPALAHRTDTTQGVTFWAEDGAKRVKCLISRETLDDHFSDDDRLSPDQAFVANRARITNFASQKYAGGYLEPDGSIMIRTGDLA